MLIYRTYACEGLPETIGFSNLDTADSPTNLGIASGPHSFEILIERDEHPHFCPICGTQFIDEPEPIPARISIGGSAAARAVDGTYDLLEKSSAERAEMAREAGLSAEQTRNIKITDIHDNLREGDVAAKLPQYPNNPVGNFMRQASQVGINYGFQGGATPGGGVYNGPTTMPGGSRVTGPTNAALGAAQGDGGSEHEQTRRELAMKGELWAVAGDRRIR